MSLHRLTLAISVMQVRGEKGDGKIGAGGYRIWCTPLPSDPLLSQPPAGILPPFNPMSHLSVPIPSSNLSHLLSWSRGGGRADITSGEDSDLPGSVLFSALLESAFCCFCSSCHWQHTCSAVLRLSIFVCVYWGFKIATARG